ncbi:MULTISPECIES: hypothetical protein [Catenuloplanes]|uniref:Uncharacterized protein n=1 Tax=Catenuloplanes niger TaxID=587534 RepID=A0AAE4CPC5_9ACTN|nr:hypothetical protein [Catenuloplanes niger]MDR7319765.1 hypothetical protein [Catenuloplanes niger]
MLVLTLAGAGLAACTATPQDRTGEVISIDPKVCVNATTGADYCFEQNPVERKVPGLEVGDCVEFAHTPPKKPGGLFHLERMNRCGEEPEEPRTAENSRDDPAGEAPPAGGDDPAGEDPAGEDPAAAGGDAAAEDGAGAAGEQDPAAGDADPAAGDQEQGGDPDADQQADQGGAAQGENGENQ